ncbi:hypothetical protein CsatA_018589 [Cannabis sativa]
MKLPLNIIFLSLMAETITLAKEELSLGLTCQYIELFFKQKHVSMIKVSLLNEENVWCTNNNEMGNITKRYYTSLFTSIVSTVENIEDLVQAVGQVVTDEMNETLVKPFSLKEIEEAVFSMPADKSPGPDGMTAMFYQKHWDIVGPLVSKTILDCLSGVADMTLINDSLITLIPKVKNPDSISDFRPISLCNVSYKIIAKMLINRFKILLPLVISGNQSAFVPGRLITDSVLIAYECLHNLKARKDGRRCNVAMKLDMSKAYDRVEWKFIEMMMLKMGFKAEWVHIIMKCVSTVSYSFQINGTIYGKVIPNRGLRQGDPLSPYLFLICAKGLSALIKQAESKKEIFGLKVAREAPSISHLFFADDSLLFLAANEGSLHSIQQIFAVYSRCSGQVKSW